MSTPTVDCGVCHSLKRKRTSLIWCLDCDEGLCNDCDQHHKVSKGTKHHVFIPIEEYKKIPTFILQMKNICMKHDEKYQMFCKTHDSPCCRKCVLENHKECTDVALIEEVIQNVKSSTSFQDLANQLKDILKNIEQIRQNRQDNAALLTTQRGLIEKELGDIRKSMNNRLDILQEQIMSELADMKGKENRKIQEFVVSLEKKQDEIKEFETNMGQIRKYASEIQAYMGMKHIEAVTIKYENYVHSLIDDGSLDQTTLSFKMNEETKKLFETLDTLGEVLIERKPAKMEFGTAKHKQAQMIVADIPLTSVDNVSLKLDKTITTDIYACRGCCLLPGGRIILTSFYAPCHLFVFTKEGTKDFSVDLKSSWPTGVTSKDDTEVAVAASRVIKFVDLEKRSITRSISTKWSMSGIEYRDGTLICCANKKGIVMLNLTDESLTTLVEHPLPSFSYVTSHDDSIYFTDRDRNKVICCECNGKIRWEFQNESLLKDPQGITIDTGGNIYVAGYQSYNIVIISPDGKKYKEILSRKDDVVLPTVLHCDKASNTLLVANLMHSALLYIVNPL